MSEAPDSHEGAAPGREQRETGPMPKDVTGQWLAQRPLAALRVRPKPYATAIRAQELGAAWHIAYRRGTIPRHSVVACRLTFERGILTSVADAVPKREFMGAFAPKALFDVG